MITPRQHLADGIQLQLEQRLGQHQAQHHDAQPERAAQPDAGDAVGVAEFDAADGRRAAEHHRRQRAQIQPRPQIAPGHQIRLFGIGAANAHPPHRAYHQKVKHHDQQIEIHGYLHSVVIVIRGPDATAPPVGSAHRPQRAGSTHNISNSRLAASSAVLPERS